MNYEFYRELAVRVVALADALQYEKAATLLHLALSTEVEPTAPDLLYDVDCAMQTAYHPVWAKTGEYDHKLFTVGINSLEQWLKDEEEKS